MNERVWLAKKRALTEEADSLERQMEGVRKKLEGVREKLAFMSEFESDSIPHNGQPRQVNRNDEPAMFISEAVRECGAAIRKFTKRELEKKIRETYPNLVFSFKSMDKPIQEVIDKGDLILARRGKGKNTPNVYEFKG